MKKFRKLLIASIVMLGVLILLLINYSNKVKMELSEPYVELENEEELLNDKIYPINFTEFYFNYNGSINSSLIYNKLYEIIKNDIPKLYLETNSFKSDTHIINYYNNQKYIKNSLSIDNISDFKRMIQILNTFNSESLKYLNCELIKSSCKSYSDRTEFDLLIVYEPEQTIKLKVVVYNVKKYGNFMKIIPILEE